MDMEFQSLFSWTLLQRGKKRNNRGNRLFVSILIFLDSPATNSASPGDARYNSVSILIFLDSPAT